jgi:hypothetical protein
MLSFFLWTIAAAINIFLLPYIITYAIAVGVTFCPMRFVATELDRLPIEIRDLMQPWIEQLEHHDFFVTNYQLVYADSFTKEPLWGLVLQHRSQQVFVGLMVRSKPTLNYPVICTFSSYWQESNLSTVNVKDFGTYSKTVLERTQHLDRAGVEEMWLGHQSFLNSVCPLASLDRLTVDEWLRKVEQTSLELVQLRVRNHEAYWVNKGDLIYRKHPWLVLKMVVKIGIDRLMHQKNRSTMEGVDRRDR